MARTLEELEAELDDLRREVSRLRRNLGARVEPAQGQSFYVGGGTQDTTRIELNPTGQDAIVVIAPNTALGRRMAWYNSDKALTGHFKLGPSIEGGSVLELHAYDPTNTTEYAGLVAAINSQGSPFPTYTAYLVTYDGTTAYSAGVDGRRQIFRVGQGGQNIALALVDAITAPGALSNFAQIYVDSADGDLKVKFADGFVATIALDS